MVKGEEHRYFDKEFKYEAIRLMNEGKRSVRDIAKDLDIIRICFINGGVNIVRIWSMHFPGRGI